MTPEFWLDRWKEDRIGFHQAEVNKCLKRHWPSLPPGVRVLVPLCGKSLDLRWLVERGYDVTGIELSPLAVAAFFREQGWDHTISEEQKGLTSYRARDRALRIVCGDFFAFEAVPFDALYDRAALIALPREERPRYTDLCRSLIVSGATILLSTLVYDQRRMEGPPFSVPAAEVSSLWEDRLRMVYSEELIGEEPRFQDKGLTSFVETTWLGQR